MLLGRLQGLQLDLARPAPGGQPAMSLLLHKLQEALSATEAFPVNSSPVSTPASYVRFADTAGGWPMDRGALIVQAWLSCTQCFCGIMLGLSMSQQLVHVVVLYVLSVLHLHHAGTLFHVLIRLAP